MKSIVIFCLALLILVLLKSYGLPTWGFWAGIILLAIPVISALASWFNSFSETNRVAEIEEMKCERCKILMNRTETRRKAPWAYTREGIHYEYLYQCPQCRSSKYILPLN